MFNTDSINYIEFKLLEGQVDLVLEALQLYAFNLHKVWVIDKDSDLEDLRNALLYHTYEEIAEKYYNSKMNYNINSRVNYDVLNSCRLERQRKRKQIYYNAKKNIA